MLPNIELIVAALIHGVLIASVLMAAVFIVLTALSSALVLILLCIPILDLHDAISLLSRSRILKSIEGNLQLGSVLVVYLFISYAAIPLHDSASTAALLRRHKFDIAIARSEELDPRRRRRITQDGFAPL